MITSCPVRLGARLQQHCCWQLPLGDLQLPLLWQYKMSNTAIVRQGTQMHLSESSASHETSLAMKMQC